MNFLDKINDSNSILFILFIFTVLLLLIYYFLKKSVEYDEYLVEGLKNPLKKAGKAISKGAKKGASVVSKAGKNVVGATNKDLIEPLKNPMADIGKIVKDIQKLGNVANNLGKEVTSLGKTVSNGIKQVEKTTTKTVNQIDKKLESFEKTVLKKANDLVITKIKNLFTGLGNVLNDGIIKPLTAVFLGIGNIFVQLFEILKKIGYKIVSLPGCILFYLINGTVSSTLGFISWFIPSWIERPIAAIWNATFGKLLGWFLGVVGYTASSKKCYGFDVDEEIDKMNKTFKKIGESFNKNFGRLDFKKIKI